MTSWNERTGWDPPRKSPAGRHLRVAEPVIAARAIGYRDHVPSSPTRTELALDAMLAHLDSMDDKTPAALPLLRPRAEGVRAWFAGALRRLADWVGT